MLAIVRIALRRPYTFIVLAPLMLLFGALAAMRMPVDISPSIDIPIIGGARQYQGLPPDQMAGRIIQQPRQGRADLSVAAANAQLAQITAERWQSLANTDAVATQDVDQRTFTPDANLAQVNSATRASIDWSQRNASRT